MCHVLIIEDEPLVALLIQDILEQEGATSFDIASSEDEAIRSALVRRPALITSDVKLTQGTGPRAVKAIHRALGEVTVLFITGTPEECQPCEPPGKIFGKPLN